MNWDDPEARFRLALDIGPANYNEQYRIHLEETTIGVVNGHPIRPVNSGRFGRLYSVVGTDQAFPTQAKAEAHAATLSPGIAAIGLATSTADLSDLYTRYCSAEALALVSADEHIPADLSADQRTWVSAFIVRWEKLQQAEDVSSRPVRDPLRADRQPRETSATIVAPLRHIAALIAGLDLLRAHADDNYENPHILEVGDVCSGLEPLSSGEIAVLRRVLYEAAETLD